MLYDSAPCVCRTRASSSSYMRHRRRQVAPAAEWFGAEQVVSSERLRAIAGAGERDQRAGGDAFEVLDLIVESECAAA